MAIFVGSHEQRIDRKGRVSVPASFRDVLGKSASFYAFPSILHDGIECRTADYMESLGTRFDDLDPFSDEQDHLSAAIFGTSVALTPDKDGRVILPDGLLRHAALTETVMFVGMGRSFQMWEPRAHVANLKQVRDRAIADRAALRRRPEVARTVIGPAESGT